MDEEKVVGVPGEKAAGEEQRGDGGGSGLQEVSAAWLVGHGVLFSVRGLQIEGGRTASIVTAFAVASGPPCLAVGWWASSGEATPRPFGMK